MARYEFDDNRQHRELESLPGIAALPYAHGSLDALPHRCHLRPHFGEWLLRGGGVRPCESACHPGGTTVSAIAPRGTCGSPVARFDERHALCGAVWRYGREPGTRL